MERSGLEVCSSMWQTGQVTVVRSVPAVAGVAVAVGAVEEGEGGVGWWALEEGSVQGEDGVEGERRWR